MHIELTEDEYNQLDDIGKLVIEVDSDFIKTNKILFTYKGTRVPQIEAYDIEKKGNVTKIKIINYAIHR